MIYILDFDGVICDSRPECMITSYLAFQTEVDPGCDIEYSASIIPKAWQEKFLSYRYLVRVAKEYKLLWRLITEGRSIKDLVRITDQIDYDPEDLASFHSLFYSVRDRWIKEDRDSWLGYNRLYKGMDKAINKWNAGSPLYLVSAKDTNSIQTFLMHSGCHLEPHQVLGTEKGDKPFHFKAIRALHGNQDMVFIDDNTDNLKMALPFDLTPYLASWGYNHPAGYPEAQRLGIQILSLEDINAI